MLLSASEVLNIKSDFIPGIASALGAGMCLRGEMCGIANGGFADGKFADGASLCGQPPAPA